MKAASAKTAKKIFREVFSEARGEAEIGVVPQDERSELREKYGLDDNEIAKYEAVGIANGKLIEKLHLKGFTGDRALESKAAGVNPFDQIAFESIGVNTLTEMQSYENSGIHSSDAVGYHNAGFTTLQEMTDLQRAGVAGRSIGEYVAAGATTIEAAIELQQAGVEGIDAELFRKCGITTAEEMKAYTKAGLRGIYARGFISYGVSDVEVIEEHIGSGITPREVLFYANSKGENHNFGFDEAITLIAGGIEATRIGEYVVAGATDAEHIVRIKRAGKTNGVTTDDLPELFGTLSELGELGAKIAHVHPAAKTTVQALKQEPELAQALDELDEQDLKVVITLAEDDDSIETGELRQLIRAMTL